MKATVTILIIAALTLAATLFLHRAERVRPQRNRQATTFLLDVPEPYAWKLWRYMQTDWKKHQKLSAPINSHPRTEHSGS